MDQKLKKQVIKKFAVLFSLAAIFVVANPQTSYAAMENKHENQKRDRSESQEDDNTNSPKRPRIEQQSSLSKEDKDKLNSDLFKAVENNNLNACRELINQGADVNATDSLGMTVLMWAAAKGRTAIVNILLVHNADVKRILGKESELL